jgi:hypothetical protein
VAERHRTDPFFLITRACELAAAASPVYQGIIMRTRVDTQEIQDAMAIIQDEVNFATSVLGDPHQLISRIFM